MNGAQPAGRLKSAATNQTINQFSFSSSPDGMYRVQEPSHDLSLPKRGTYPKDQFLEVA